MMIHYYRSVQTCVKYQVYEFDLPSQLTESAYQKLRHFIANYGENTNPTTINVLHIENRLFFIDFPSYKFPVFKISFFKQTTPEQVEYYLQQISGYLAQLLLQT